MIDIHRLARRRGPTVNTGIWTAALLVAMASAISVGRAAQDSIVMCSATITGTVDALVVPAGATCTATNLQVTGDVTIEPGATLSSVSPGLCDPGSASSFTVGRRITLADASGLIVTTVALSIGEDVQAQNARTVVLIASPCTGASGVVGGDVSIDGTDAVSLLGLQIRGDVIVRKSGADGLEIGASSIAGSLGVENNAVIGAQSPALFALHFNTVGRGALIIGNDATGAYQMPFVGGNTISGGNLICANNTPVPSNRDFDVVVPNVVVKGVKTGQCSDL